MRPTLPIVKLPPALYLSAMERILATAPGYQGSRVGSRYLSRGTRVPGWALASCPGVARAGYRHCPAVSWAGYRHCPAVSWVGYRHCPAVSWVGYRHCPGCHGWVLGVACPVTQCHTGLTAPSDRRWVRGVLQSPNVLSAVLCLIKELDLHGLEVVDTAVRCRIQELED